MLKEKNIYKKTRSCIKINGIKYNKLDIVGIKEKEKKKFKEMLNNNKKSISIKNISITDIMEIITKLWGIKKIKISIE